MVAGLGGGGGQILAGFWSECNHSPARNQRLEFWYGRRRSEGAKEFWPVPASF
jgi:hypothetical protein